MQNKQGYSVGEFIIISLSITISIYLAVIAYSFGGIDFGVYYAAGRIFLQGGNPYDFTQLAREIVSSTGTMNNPYYYAPWFTWMLSLLAIFPYNIARILWAIINFFLWFWGLINLSKLVSYPFDGWRQWGWYLFVTFLFAWSTWGSEQVGILIFFIFVTVLFAYQHENFFAMGVWMALLLFKPNITAIPIVLLSAWLLRQRRWEPVVMMLGTILFMVIASLIFSPDWHLQLLQPDKIDGLSYTLNESGGVQVQRYTTTLVDWFATLGILNEYVYIIYGIVVLIGVFFSALAVLRFESINCLIAFAILLNFSLVPYALFYDYVLLTITLFFINARLSLNLTNIWPQRLMNILLLVCLFVGENISYRYWIIVILFSFAIFGKVFNARQTD